MNIVFQIPLPQEEAEKNEGLREFTEALVLCLVNSIPKEEEDQTLLVVLKDCHLPDCKLEYPHLVDYILSEKQLSEQFLLNFSAVSDNVRLTQLGEKIVFEYI